MATSFLYQRAGYDVRLPYLESLVKCGFQELAFMICFTDAGFINLGFAKK